MVSKKKAYGLTTPFIDILPEPVFKTAAPTSSEKNFDIGQVWVYKNGDTRTSYMFGGLDSSGNAVWILTGPGASDVDQLKGDTGTATPAGGIINILGGTNITTTGASPTGDDLTVALDAAISLATSVTSPIYTTSAAAMNINSAANQNIIMQMGDAAGVQKISFEDSGSVEVASLDSDGTLTVVNMDGIIGATTPAAGTFTTVTASTSVDSPLVTATGADIKVEAVAGQNIVLNMSDAGGVQKVSFTDSADAEVFSVDSDGNLSTIAGTLTVTGLFTANGSATINTGGTALNLATDNSGDPVNIGTGATIRSIGIGNSGAVAHTIALGSSSAGAITVDSSVGIDITSAEAASSDGVNIVASAADGGVTLDAGTGGINIGISADCTPIGVGDIAPTASRTITIGGGTVVTAAVTDTIDIGPDGATTNADSIKTVNVNTGGVTTGQVLTNIASGTITSGTHTVSIQTGNAAAGTVALNLSTGTGTKIVSLGNADANTTFNIDAVTLINDSVNANTSINTGNSTGTVSIGNSAAGAIEVDTAAGISLDAATASNFTVTGAADLTLTSTAGSIPITAGEADAAAIALQASSGGLDIDTGLAIIADAAGNIELNSSAGQILIGNDAVNQNISLGTAGARTVTVGSTTGASGLVLQAGTGEITVTGTVKEISAEFLEASGDEITSISQSPILTTAANTAGVATGANGDVNLMYLQQGVLMEQFIIGTQTIIGPRMDTNGLLVSLDLTVAEGAEYNFGAARTNSRHAFTIGTDAAFFFEIGLYINDMDGAAPYVIGFRKSEANNATFASYTDYAAIGMNAASSTTNIVTITELNGGGQTITDTTDAWGGDGSTNTLRVLVDASGNVTYTINGSAPSASAAFQFDTPDVVVPFIHLLHSASATQVNITSLKVGYQA